MPLPYEEPQEVVPEELEVQGDTSVEIDDDDDIQLGDDGQIGLSFT